MHFTYGRDMRLRKLARSAWRRRVSGVTAFLVVLPLLFAPPPAAAEVSVLPQPVLGTTVVSAIGAPVAIDPRGALADDPDTIRVVRAYRTSGRFLQDQRDVAAAASAWLDTWTSSACHGSCRPAIIVDIDDTLLDWYPTFERKDFAPTSAQLAAAHARCTASVIAPVRRLVRSAKAAGVRVVIMTGRRERSRAATSLCLQQKRVPFDALILRNTREQTLSAAQYKSARRAGLEASGWTIGLSIGDQLSDLAGGHAARGFLMPNPLYTIP